MSSVEYDITIHRAATVMQAIHLLEKGEWDYAAEQANSVLPIDDPERIIDHSFYYSDLLVPLIQKVLQDTHGVRSQSRWLPWRKHFNTIVRDFRCCYEQRLWHAARYLVGDIGDAAFLAQPSCYDAERELLLMKALEADFAGKPDEAAAFYRNYEGTLVLESFTPAVMKVFIRWRLTELGKTL